MGVLLYELCAQKPPFDAMSLPQLSQKIMAGRYNSISNIYSSDLKDLLSQLLHVNPEMRPDVNAILQMPVIRNRIKSFLSEHVRQDEFSHTILHKDNVFNPKPRRLMRMNTADELIRKDNH